MTGFWDDAQVKKAASGGQYASLREVGDVVEGKVGELKKRVFNQGQADERTAIEVAFEDGPSFTAGQVLLMRALYELKPTVGDGLRVELADIEKNGSKTLKKFRVELTRPDGSKKSVDHTL